MIDLHKKVAAYETVALVLQGGGALGSYQAGVFEGLADAGIEPNWISGISIGALNTAIIAGNPPRERVHKLKAFWDKICRPAFMPPTPAVGFTTWYAQLPSEIRMVLNGWEAVRTMMEGQRGFFVPRVFTGLDGFGVPGGPSNASFYDTSVLKETLEQFADFDRINHGGIKVSVGAVNVATGNFKYFDNQDPNQPLRAEHFMASGALPPAFPAVEIDGEFYWDGGLLSNTPLYDVLKGRPKGDTLAFQVDLWSARGPLPTNLFDVSERQKDIQYSSRTRLVTDTMRQLTEIRKMVADLLGMIPPEKRKKMKLCRLAEEYTCTSRFNVIHLIYRDKEYEGHFKDYEFSHLTMREHWLTGLEDIRRTLLHPEWLERPSDEHPFVTHDIHQLDAMRRTA